MPPTAISDIQHDRVTPVTLELEAYRTGSKDRLLELIQLDPWTRAVDQARTPLDEIPAMSENAPLAAHVR